MADEHNVATAVAEGQAEPAKPAAFGSEQDMKGLLERRSGIRPWKEPKTAEGQADAKGQAGQDEQPEEHGRAHVAKEEWTAEQIEQFRKTGEVPPEPKEQKQQESDSKQAAAKEDGAQRTHEPANSYDRLLERASKEPQFDKFVERMTEPFFPTSQEGFARLQVMGHALNQVSNPEDVVYFLARPENGAIARKMQDAPPAKIAQVIHQVSADLRFGGAISRSESEAPERELPPPPREIGGRSVSTGDPGMAAHKANPGRLTPNLKAIWNKQSKDKGR